MREVAEETGQRCELGPELAPARYRDRYGRDKLVRWWLMRPIADDGFTPGREIDDLRWLSPADAIALLDYEHDRKLVGGLEQTSSS